MLNIRNKKSRGGFRYFVRFHGLFHIFRPRSFLAQTSGHPCTCLTYMPLYMTSFIHVYTVFYIYICMCIRIYNAPALPACNWSKARLVPPLGWTNGYAQAKANPCASSSTAITTSFSSSNNVLLLLLPGDRAEIVTVASCEAKNAKIGWLPNRNFVKSWWSAARSIAHHSFAY